MRTLSLLLLTFLLLPPFAMSQTGFPAFGSFQSTGFDAVNNQNLNVIFVVPISSTQGRGQIFQYGLTNNSLLWTKTTAAPITWTPITDAAGNPSWGWNYSPAVAGSGQVLSTVQARNCRYIDPDTGLQAFASYTLYTVQSYQDWLGTTHRFGTAFIVSTPSAETNCGIASSSFPIKTYASDNTGFLLTVNGPGQYSVSSPAGVNAGAAPVDTNGNFVSQTSVSANETDWTDTAGHVALKVIKSGNNLLHEWQDASGTYSAATTATVVFGNFNIKTNFNCPGVGEYTGTASLPTEIDLPNGQKYVVTYEPTPNFAGYYTGRVQRIALPTGGYYEYDYPATAGDGIVCADGTVNSLTRIVNDGTNSATWVFSRSGTVITVTAPPMPYDSAPNNYVYTFNSGGQLTTAQFYQGAVNAANLKRTVMTTWAANGTPATQTTILEDGHTENEIETTYDSYGNLTVLKEHDWGNGAPGPVLRSTNITYLNSAPYVAANILNRPTSITVADGSGTIHSRTAIAYDESGYINAVCHTGVPQHSDTFGCGFTVRGNPTTITTYTNASAPSGAITHHSYYDNLGNLVQADLDCCQSKTWSYSVATNYSFPDSATRGSAPGTQLTTSATYNPYTGLPATSVDENGQVTRYTFDNLKRLTNLQRPDGVTLTWSYNDAMPPAQSSVTASVPVQGTSTQQTVTALDGLGRVVSQQVTDGTTTYSVVATQYDPAGRIYKTSNPYNSTAQYWTTTHFDALGRLTASILPDGSQTSFSYAANTTTVIDPAGKARQSVTDGLGRMISVYEPDPTSGNTLTLQTSYAYTVQDLVTSVTQGSQTRTYSYDDLGRATSIKTPETNQLAYQYQYNSFGEVTQRTDPRGVVTTYGYDNLNRLVSISYNVGSTGVPATPGVTLAYDQGGAAANSLGRLTSMSDGVGSESYSYNNLGQLTRLQKVINGVSYTTAYSYNLAGELAQLTYPSGRVVLQNHDALGRLCSVGASASTCSSGTLYASGFGYNAAQQVTGFNYGNGVAAAFTYTPDRLLLQSLAYTKGSTTLFSTNYWYKGDGTNCPSGASGNNGQIQCITDNVDPGRTMAYAYDTLYRLTSAVTNGSAGYPKWGLSMSYDRYGNRLAQTATFDTPPGNAVSVDASTNRINASGYAYDANGNMTSDGNNTLVYDAENRVVSAANGGASGSYTYDGNGQRVVKSSGGATTVSIFLGQQVLAEYDNGALPSAPTNEYIYAGGQRIMSVQSGVTDYWHYDHLSPRLRTDASGNVADQRGTFPFGDSWYSPGQSPYMLTTYERDTESGNDYAMARFYGSSNARFASPDPIPGSTSDPQSLNTYSYVESDPANLVDPLGLCPSPGICITVSAPYWPGGPSLPSTSAVFFGGAGPGDINAEGQIFARTGRGNTSGPRMRPEKPVPPCRIVDPFLAALEFTIKVGPEIQAGPVRLGGSLYENLTTGDTGVKIEGSVGLVGAQIDNPTPPGGNLGGTTEGTQTSVSFLGFEYNFTTHRFQFAPSKSFSLGLQLGVGGEVSFNSATFKQQSAANAACRTQGGN